MGMESRIRGVWRQNGGRSSGKKNPNTALEIAHRGGEALGRG